MQSLAPNMSIRSDKCSRLRNVLSFNRQASYFLIKTDTVNLKTKNMGSWELTWLIQKSDPFSFDVVDVRTRPGHPCYGPEFGDCYSSTHVERFRATLSV